MILMPLPSYLLATPAIPPPVVPVPLVVELVALVMDDGACRGVFNRFWISPVA